MSVHTIGNPSQVGTSQVSSQNLYFHTSQTCLSRSPLACMRTLGRDTFQLPVSSSESPVFATLVIFLHVPGWALIRFPCLPGARPSSSHSQVPVSSHSDPPAPEHTLPAPSLKSPLSSRPISPSERPSSSQSQVSTLKSPDQPLGARPSASQSQVPSLKSGQAQRWQQRGDGGHRRRHK